MRINHQVVGETRLDCQCESQLGQQIGGARMECREELKLQQQLGSQQGYAQLEEALKITEFYSGADVILQGSDQRFYPVQMSQNPLAGPGSAKRDRIQIDDKSYKVVCFVDKQNQVLAQADGDKESVYSRSYGQWFISARDFLSDRSSLLRSSSAAR